MKISLIDELNRTLLNGKFKNNEKAMMERNPQTLTQNLNLENLDFNPLFSPQTTSANRETYSGSDPNVETN